MEAVGLALGQVRAQLRKEFAAQLADVRAEIDSRLNGGLSHDDKIVVVPKFLESRRAA